MEIARLLPDQVSQLEDLIRIFCDVFETEASLPDRNYLQTLLARPEFWVFVVRLENQVVGGLTVYLLPGYYSTKPQAYVYDVGISPAFQRKGLGKKLLQGVVEFCRKNGCESAYVEAEEEDLDAVSFYRKTGFTSEIGARHFTCTWE